jgi:hypothetical protein
MLVKVHVANNVEAVRTKNFFDLRDVLIHSRSYEAAYNAWTMELLLKGKAQYGWPPCTN